MVIDKIKSFWQGRSTRTKWIIGVTAGVVMIGVGNAKDNDDRAAGDQQYRLPGTTMMSGCAPGDYRCQMTYRGTAPGPTIVSGGSNPIQNGAQEYSNDWDRQQAGQDRAARGFSQYLRGQTDIQDASNGQITTDVPNETADPAITSGAYNTAPPAAVEPAPISDSN